LGASNAAPFVRESSPNPSLCGTLLKTLFTIGAAARYVPGMIILATAVLAAIRVPHAQAPVSPERQAQAMVIILPSASLRFSEIERTDPRALRETRLRGADGKPETVKLVEFE
jgi:hypothetical protein